MNTVKFRKAAKVKYPATYAPESRTDVEANRFNCAQRSHANFTENQPSFLVALLVSGLRFPLAAAAMGAGWSVCRVLYMTGYTRGDEGGKGRYQGILHTPLQAVLTLMAAYTGVMMILEK
jgi:glutathione S-transferase